MGDVACPKRRDMFDRLRRRIEMYKRRHSSAWGRPDPLWTNGFGDDSRRQEIQMLQQRWQETKAKRAGAKADKSSPKLKRKLTAGADPNCLPSELGCNSHSYDYDGGFQPPTKSSRPYDPVNNNAAENQLHGSVSVNIVHNIDASLNQTQGEIKLTFSSTLNARPGAGHHVSDSSNYEDVPEASGNLPHSNRSSQNSHSDSLGLDDLDELSDFLDHIGSQEEEIPSDILKDLDQGLREFELGFNCDAKSGMPFKHSSIGIKENHPGHIENFNKAYKTNPLSGIFADPLYGPSRTAGPVFSGARGQVSTPMSPFVSQRDACAMTGVLSAPPLMGDTGPAAETLKQMAAQHQSQENAQYGMATDIPSQFGLGDYCSGYPRSGLSCTRPYATHGYDTLGPKMHHGYPLYGPPINGYQQGPESGTMIPVHMMAKGTSKMDPVSYRMTRPLSHYPETMSSPMPSSLQKLQNQVQSHFGPSSSSSSHSQQQQQLYIHQMPEPCRLEMSQNQQLKMQHASGHHICITNSQQVMITGDNGVGGIGACSGSTMPNISMTQQQSFNLKSPHPISNSMRMPPPTPPQQMYPEEIGHGSYELQQQRLQQKRGPQSYGSWLPQNVAGQSGVKMGNSRHGNSCSAAANSPLRTIQNMVDKHEPVETDLNMYGGRVVGSSGSIDVQMASEPGGSISGISSVPFTYFQASQQQMMSVNSAIPSANENVAYNGATGSKQHYGNSGAYPGSELPYDSVMYNREQGNMATRQHGCNSTMMSSAEPMEPVTEPTTGRSYESNQAKRFVGYSVPSIQTSVAPMAVIQQQQQLSVSSFPVGQTMMVRPVGTTLQNAYGHRTVTDPIRHMAPQSSSLSSCAPSGGSTVFAATQYPSLVADDRRTASGGLTDCMSLDLVDSGLDCTDYFSCPNQSQTDLTFIEEIFNK